MWWCLVVLCLWFRCMFIFLIGYGGGCFRTCREIGGILAWPYDVVCVPVPIETRLHHSMVGLISSIELT